MSSLDLTAGAPATSRSPVAELLSGSLHDYLLSTSDPDELADALAADLVKAGLLLGAAGAWQSADNLPAPERAGPGLLLWLPGAIRPILGAYVGLRHGDPEITPIWMAAGQRVFPTHYAHFTPPTP